MENVNNQKFTFLGEYSNKSLRLLRYLFSLRLRHGIYYTQKGDVNPLSEMVNVMNSLIKIEN